ncbi:disulfide isomerase-like 1-4 [Olea europaea subsp. europaea]|uniref:Disulfide isomerase-like 1-4 n=1 Tax=Olea europaea subsp. europaea TaxID=158383 RepID=A0A8S0QE17_OLEEU|nr:disulfide isomerase-like 1-4 [Olea europaea subsp. europaea]
MYATDPFGPESAELDAASKLDDDVDFYQTANPNVGKMFHMEPSVKHPALVLLKEETEKVTHYVGQFTKSSIAKFVFANKLPLVTTFTRESAPLIFESPIKKQLLLFTTSKDSDKVVPAFQEAAKLFKGKLLFVHVEMDDEDVGKPVADYFGVTGDASKAFGEDFLQDKLKPFYNDDGDVKTVIRNNFDEIVLDGSKDVLLEIYAPWCGYCQALEPTYKKLTKHLRGIESLVIAKMDGTTMNTPGPRPMDSLLFSSSQLETRVSNLLLLTRIEKLLHSTNFSRNTLRSLPSSRNQLRLQHLRILMANEALRAPAVTQRMNYEYYIVIERCTIMSQPGYR